MGHRRSLSASMMMLPLLLLLLAASLTSGSPAMDPTCSSFECVTLASEMISMMNQSADPCTDFHNYACGNFPNTVRYNHANAHVGEAFGEMLFEDSLGIMKEMVERNIYEMLILDRSVTSDNPSMNKLYNFTRMFFRSCGQWMQQSQVANDSYNTALSVEFFRDVYDHLMMSIDPSGRPNGTFESVLATLTKSGGQNMMQMRLTTGLANALLREEVGATEKARAAIRVETKTWSCEPEFSGFVQFLVSNGIGESLLLENRTESLAAMQSNLHCIGFAAPWDKLFQERNCTVDDSQSEFTVSELDSISSCFQPENPFSWSLYLEKLLHTSVDSKTKLRFSSVKSVIHLVSYFKELPLYTSNQTKFNERVSYFIFDWLTSFSDYWPREVRQGWRVFGTPADQLKRITGDIAGGCMQLTKQYLQPIFERMYQRTYHSSSFDDVKNIVNLVKRASISSMNSQLWISPTAKEAIAAKIQSMQLSIGFKELSNDQMMRFYDSTLRALELTNLSSNLQDSFGSLYALALCADARKNFEIIAGDSPVSYFMILNPLVVNAYNYMEKNQIIFPMAILAPRVYHSSYPDYIKLGSLGYIIGHEVGHGFDNIGHDIKKSGATGQIWDSKTDTNFHSRMTCVEKAFGNFTLYPGGPRHLSAWSRGNDIADIMGIRAAYEAMQIRKAEVATPGIRTDAWIKMPNIPSGLTAGKLFFIQAAQSWCYKAEQSALVKKFGEYPTHSPHAIRVNGMMQTMKEFAVTFQCRIGAPMHPQEKCSFW